MQDSLVDKSGVTVRSTSRTGHGPSSVLLLVALTGLFGVACSQQAQETAAESNNPQPAAPTAMQKGLFTAPGIERFALHNEYDDDGDGDKVKETHVRRYIAPNGDSAFSLSTNGRLWAWSLESKGGSDSDLDANYVIRDSNCDGVFDERYSLDAEFHVPVCVFHSSSLDMPVSARSRMSQ